MAANEIRNLDQLTAQTAQQIVNQADSAKELEILATKTLGVLQENGVYAAALFLESRTRKAEQELAEKIRLNLYPLPAQILTGKNVASSEDIAKNLAGDLDALLLVKQLWEQTLIYVRYGAKAKRQEKGNRRQNAQTSALSS